MNHSAKLRDELASLDPRTKVDVYTTMAPSLAQPIGGELEFVGEDYIVVGFYRLHLTHVVAVRLQK